MSEISTSIRWTLEDQTTGERVALPINPNKMDALSQARNMTWAGAANSGINRMRGIDGHPATAPTWTFGGLILTQGHYDILLAWMKRQHLLYVYDHLGHRMSVAIQKFDPVERQATPARPWRVDFVMTCLLLHTSYPGEF